MRRDKRSRRGRSGVVRLNRGSSPYGVSSTFRLNQPGGAFGSGRTAGGGAGAGKTLAQALMSPAPSIMGSVADYGPPPAALSPPGPEMGPAMGEHRYVAPWQPPAFDPTPVPVGALGGFAPIFTPEPKKPRGRLGIY